MRLFSYKMTNDSGFAPNPFWGRLTLATCKPEIRKAKRVGDWIAGFTSRDLCGDPVGSERLVYLMQVADRMPIGDYFLDPQFQNKIPTNDSLLRRRGDNIYRPRKKGAAKPGDFVQLDNESHYDKPALCSVGESRRTDIGGKFVLIADRFAYFGRNAVDVPPEARPKIPKGQHPSGYQTHDDERATLFIEYVFGKAKSRRILGPPTSWEPGDESWKEFA
jgi:Nucleotide modification associated domain 2